MGKGILWNGNFYQIEGVETLGPGDYPWIKLTMPEDAWWRNTNEWIRQVILHTTKGTWPQSLLHGGGRGGKDKAFADMINNDGVHGSVPLIVDNDGSVACFADVKKVMCWHATVSNNWSIGVEMYQEAFDPVSKTNPLYEVVEFSTVKLTHKLCELAGIPKFIPSRVYNGHPMARMLRGGPDMAGVFGHRDNTEQRGQGDPGDHIFELLAASGMRRVDYEKREDIEIGKRVQTHLNQNFGTRLAVDGLMGPLTMALVEKHHVDYLHI